MLKVVVVFVAIIVALFQFERTWLEFGTTIMLFDEIYEAILHGKNRTDYNQKTVLPFVFEFIHTYSFKKFHSNIIDAKAVKEIILSDSTNNYKPINTGFLNEPIVIRNFSGLVKSQATQMWTKEFFYRKYPNHNITMIFNATCNRIRNSNNNNCGLTNVMNYRTFIDTTDKTNQSLIAFSFDHLNSQSPELLEMLNWEFAQKHFVEQTNVGDIWIKNDNETTISHMHTAGLVNKVLAVDGVKEWTFFEPKYGPYLKPYPYHYVSEIYNRSDNYVPEMDKNIINYLPRYKVTTYPGDLLLFGPHWWHHVTTYPGWTVGVTFRASSAAAAFYQHPIRSLIDSFTAFRIFKITDVLKLVFGVQMDKNPGAQRAAY